jgi:hypothetical protein
VSKHWTNTKLVPKGAHSSVAKHGCHFHDTWRMMKTTCVVKCRMMSKHDVFGERLGSRCVFLFFECLVDVYECLSVCPWCIAQPKTPKPYLLLCFLPPSRFLTSSGHGDSELTTALTRVPPHAPSLAWVCPKALCIIVCLSRFAMGGPVAQSGIARIGGDRRNFQEKNSELFFSCLFHALRRENCCELRCCWLWSASLSQGYVKPLRTMMLAHACPTPSYNHIIRLGKP